VQNGENDRNVTLDT